MDFDPPKPNPDESLEKDKKDDGEGGKKSLSRSSTDECDEWVLVNSLGCEFEGANPRHTSDVDATAVFKAAALPTDAAVAMLVDVKQSACAELTTESSSPVNAESKEELKDAETGVPSATQRTTIADDSPEAATLDVTKTTVEEDSPKAGKIGVNMAAELLESSDEASVVTHSENTILLEEIPTSSMESSLATTDTGSYDVVDGSELQNDEPGEQGDDNPCLGATGHDAPVNFVVLYGSRVRYYIQSSNVPLNWKVSLFVVIASIAVLGLGIGHFIGKTEVVLPHQSDIRSQQDHLKRLHGQLVDCLARLNQAETELENGRTRYGSQCKEGYCRANELSDCGKTGDVEGRISECSKRLEACQARMHVLETESNNHSDSMMKAFRDLRLLRNNLLQVYAIYERLSDLLIGQGRHLNENGGKTNDRKSDTLDDEKAELLKKLREAESREEKLVKQEIELRRMLTNLDSTVEALNAELAKMKSKTSEYKGHYESCAKKFDTADDDEEGPGDDKGANSELNWNLLKDLLKDGAKFNQIFEAYLGVFKDIKLPDINISNMWLEQLPASLEELATNLKQILDEKVQEVEQTVYTTDWDAYVQKAKTVTSQMGETVGDLWQKAKDMSDQVRERHAEQGEEILQDIKTTAKKAAEVLDKRWDQAVNFWRDLAESVGVDDDLEYGTEQATAADAPPEDHVWIEDLGLPLTEDTTYDGTQDGQPESQQWTKKGDETNGRKSNWIKPYDDELLRDAVENIQYGEMTSEDEIKELRESLKSSSAFSRRVSDEFAVHYFRQLKQAAAGLMSAQPREVAAWWMCQKLWWAGNSYAYGRKCSDKLMTWQRHVSNDNDIRQELLDDAPGLKMLIQRFANDATRKHPGGSNWVFEWAKNRQDMRKDKEHKNNEKNWLYKRWRSRDEKRQADPKGSVGQAGWSFRRGWEREKKRDDDQQRKRANGVKQQTKKQPTFQHSQNRRR